MTGDHVTLHLHGSDRCRAEQRIDDGGAKHAENGQYDAEHRGQCRTPSDAVSQAKYATGDGQSSAEITRRGTIDKIVKRLELTTGRGGQCQSGKKQRGKGDEPLRRASGIA
ncbi:MAG: hypothetical protein ACE5EH_05495 [Gammaproteobacteria bacterium]